MRSRIVDKGVPADKVELIPNFVDLDDMPPTPKENEFSRRYGVQDKFMVSYAGNMGVPQGLHTVVEAAALMRDVGRLQFMLVGSGSEKQALEKLAADLGLSNLEILPYQPYSMMPQLYGASDVCLVTQAAETGCEAVPSKVYRIMACGRPVIAVTDPASDLATLVTSVGCGVAVPPGSAEALRVAVMTAHNNPAEWQEMGARGRQHVLQNYTRPVVTAHYHDLIQRLHRESGQRDHAHRADADG